MRWRGGNRGQRDQRWRRRRRRRRADGHETTGGGVGADEGGRGGVRMEARRRYASSRVPHTAAPHGCPTRLPHTAAPHVRRHKILVLIAHAHHLKALNVRHVVAVRLQRCVRPRVRNTSDGMTTSAGRVYNGEQALIELSLNSKPGLSRPTYVSIQMLILD